MADLPFNTIANGHGPLLRYNMEQLVGNYRDWSLSVEKGTTQVMIPPPPSHPVCLHPKLLQLGGAPTPDP